MVKNVDTVTDTEVVVSVRVVGVVSVRVVGTEVV